MKTICFSCLASLIFMAACTSRPEKPKDSKNSSAKSNADIKQQKPADLSTILSRKEVPVLCYHHIRGAKPGQSEALQNYSVSPEKFAEQMKALKDSGYETILPNQLYDYLVYGGKLPLKPVMLTFDDTDEEQFSIAETEMQKYGFKGVYFVMTVSINRPRYMTKEQLKQLSVNGNVIEGHTWDHHMVTKYKGLDYDTQLVRPKKLIESITGKQVEYFAYPFGIWNEAVIPELKKDGYKMAFILSSKRDSAQPLYTIRRMLVPGQWSVNGMFKAMRQTFHLN